MRVAGSPSLKRIMAGMLMTSKRRAMPGCSSTFSFAMRLGPDCAVAIASRIGAMALHGPHHSAQKSTRTGSSAEPISSSKVASDRVVMVDMEVGFLSERDGGGGGLVPLSQQR